MLVLVVMVLVFDHVDGHAGPIRLRWSTEVGAANHASTSGDDACMDQLSEKAHCGLGTVRW